MRIENRQSIVSGSLDHIRAKRAVQVTLASSVTSQELVRAGCAYARVYERVLALRCSRVQW